VTPCAWRRGLPRAADVLKKKGYNTGGRRRGGFAPDLKTNEEALQLILAAIEKAGYKAARTFFIALDPAASEFYSEKEKKYVLEARAVSASARRRW